MKKRSQMQEINHNRAIIEIKKARFTKREKSTQLNGKVWSCKSRTERVYSIGHHRNNK